MLEDFLSTLIQPDDALWQRATGSVDDIPQEQRRFKSGKLSKAYIHTWLAWQEEPGRPFGIALTAKYLDAGAPAAQIFIGWLRRLVEAGRPPA